MRPARKSAAPRAGASAADGGGASDASVLEEASAQIGLAIDADAARRLVEYCALLRKWNAVYNLTAISDPAAMLVQHVLDCLAIVPPLARAGLLDAATVLDAGSGAGLPGVVLATIVPGAQVHCVDTVGKKVAFLRQVRGELALPNLHAHHARVEELRTPRDLPAATLIVSRAFTSLADFVSLTRHLLAPGGRWAAMKGTMPDDELAALPAGVRLAHAFKLAVPKLDAQRHLLLLEQAA